MQDTYQQPSQPQAIGIAQQPLAEDEESINLSDFFTLCIRSWKWFVMSVVVCLGIAVIYILAAPKVYTRNAQVMVQDEDANTKKDVTSALSDMGLFTTPANVANELLAFQSPALMGDVINRLGLRASYSCREGLRTVPLYGDSLVIDAQLPDVGPRDQVSMKMEMTDDGKIHIYDMVSNEEETDYDAIISIGDTVSTPAGHMILLPGPKYSTEYDKTIKYFKSSMPQAIAAYQKNFSAELANDDATVIDFTIEDNDVQRGDDILKTIIDIYNEKWVEQKAQMALATSDFINERLKVIEQELGNVDSDIASYKGEHLIPDVQTASEMYLTNANESSKRQLEVQTQIDITRFLIEYMKAPENRGKLLPGNLGIENEGISRQIDEYNTQQLQRDQLLASTGEGSPLIKDLDGSLSSLKSALEASLGTQMRMLQTQLSALMRSDKTTTAKIASSPSQAKYLLSVERQQKVKESLYLFLLQKREENELSLAFTPYNTRLITPPTGQTKPSSPIPQNILLIAFVLGLLAPAVVLFLSETLNNRIRSRADLESVNVPFIGEIPEKSTGNNRMSNLRRRMRERLGKPSRIESAPMLIVKPHGTSILNESFRMVRSNLEFMLKNGKNRVAMVTSFNPGSGKSFISINLGAAMSLKRKDEKVLIIDLDLRRASSSRLVGNNSPGISDYLYEVTDDIDSIVRPTEQQGLYVIPVGTIPPNPSELLYSPRLRYLIDKMRTEYDFILLDCPPVDVVADATIITPLADMTVFVVRAGLLDRRLLPELNKMYDSRRFNNLLLILNGTTSIATPYRRYAYTNYYSKKD